MSYASFKLPKERSIFSLFIALARMHAVVCKDVTRLERVKNSSDLHFEGQRSHKN